MEVVGGSGEPEVDAGREHGSRERDDHERQGHGAVAAALQRERREDEREHVRKDEQGLVAREGRRRGPGRGERIPHGKGGQDARRAKHRGARPTAGTGRADGGDHEREQQGGGEPVRRGDAAVLRPGEPDCRHQEDPDGEGPHRRPGPFRLENALTRTQN